jgi:hypothetical protein
MADIVKVFPTKATALNVWHPIAGKAKPEGAEWPYDVFTCSRLADGSFTDDPKQAFKPPPAKTPADKPFSAAAAAAQDGNAK